MYLIVLCVFYWSHKISDGHEFLFENWVFRFWKNFIFDDFSHKEDSETTHVKTSNMEKNGVPKIQI